MRSARQLLNDKDAMEEFARLDTLGIIFEPESEYDISARKYDAYGQLDEDNIAE